MEGTIPPPFPRGLTANAMPLHFGDPDAETQACVTNLAVFDYSFILRVQVQGPDAQRAVLEFCGRDLSRLPRGCIRYALHGDSYGNLLSDVTVWRTGPEQFELMSGRSQDVEDLGGIITPLNAQMIDLSTDTACFAVQGPETDRFLTQMGVHEDLYNIPYFEFRDLPMFGEIFRVGRLGFTGLPGVEILSPRSTASSLWRKLSSKIRPAGMIAADRIRLSAGFVLFTQEFAPEVTAADAGLGRFRSVASAEGNQRQIRVCRVSFRAQKVSGSLEEALWSEGQIFPPSSGKIAVTSIRALPGTQEVFGMGYLNTNEKTMDMIESSKNLRDISIIHRFENN